MKTFSFKGNDAFCFVAEAGFVPPPFGVFLHSKEHSWLGFFLRLSFGCFSLGICGHLWKGRAYVNRVPGVTSLDIHLLGRNQMKQAQGLCAPFLVDNQMQVRCAGSNDL